MKKEIKGEKYIYLLMGYERAKQGKKLKTEQYASIGNDNGMKGGFNFWRSFAIQTYKGKTLLRETKSSKACADYSRYFEVNDNKDNSRVYIYEALNESGENLSVRWEH
jgi:hypothetical protein